MTQEAPDELLSVLQSLSPALKSVDVRTVAVSPPSQEHWHNLVTSIIISEKTLNKVRNEHKKLPAFRNNQFAIFNQVLPFDYEIFDQILKGEIKFFMPYGRTRIQFGEFDPLSLKVSSTQEWLDGRPTWLLKATHRDSGTERGEFWTIVQDQNIEAKRRGYPNIQELLSKSLRTKITPGQPRDFELVIPSLAKINSACFIGKRFEVKIWKPVDLEGLQLNLTLKRLRGHSFNPIWNGIQKVGEGKPEPDKNFCLVKEVIELDNLLPFDRMEVELIIRESTLTFDKTDEEAPLENVVEPFLKTLGAFCRLEELKIMLLEPENFGRKPETVFEIAVTWLLSLAGFSTIYLGTPIKIPKSKKHRNYRDRQFDVLLSQSGHAIGCADIIAYEENKRIFLIDCDIGSFDAKKILDLAETKKHFRKKLKDYKKLPIVPILFTPKDIRKSSPSIDVMIADQPIIRRIFEAVVQGDLEEARSILYYPGL